MEKILRWFILMLLILAGGCKPKHTTTTVHHFASDTLIKHEVNDIRLPVYYYTHIKEPCKDSVLRPIDELIAIGKDTARISNQNGDLVVEIEKPADTTSTTTEKKSHNENIVIEKIIEVKVTPKWAWYSLVYCFLSTIIIFRKPLLTLIRKFIIPV